MCMIEGAELSTVSYARACKARKNHQCSECGRTILPREVYERWTGLTDGLWDSCATCAHCLKAREWLMQMCDGFLYEGVLMDLEEHVGEGHASDPYLRAYVAGMQRCWRWPNGELVPLPPACPPQEKLLTLAGWGPDEDEVRPWVP